MRKRFTDTLLIIFIILSFVIGQRGLELPDKVLMLPGQHSEAIAPYSFDARAQLYHLFGIPVRAAQVVVAQQEVDAVGQVVGIRLKTDGLHVIGVSDIPQGDKVLAPARDAGVKVGDTLTHFGGTRIESSAHLSKLVDANGQQSTKISILREQKEIELELTPAYYTTAKEYKLGLWVRDSTAGIGTLTFYDETTGTVGALGHGIADTNTGMLYPVEAGEYVDCDLLAIVKGERGSPGELKGSNSDNVIADIKLNTPQGVFGTVTGNTTINRKKYPVALKSDVHTGDATILSNIEGDKVEEFRISIVRRDLSDRNKDMVVKVVDEKLLEKTGGIVQGMSGSPIIQDGKLIGAITHVFVNDPTMGYGIYIEQMLTTFNG